MPASKWLATTGTSAGAGARSQCLVQLSKPKLLIMDEFGYVPFEPAAAHLLFQMVSRRYERGRS